MNASNTDITLVIFTCSGREHLLKQTLPSFYNACNWRFNKLILAIDGPVSQDAINQVQPDLIVQSYTRKGYINSIISALKNIDSPYFFWLEDDWGFPVNFSLDNFVDQLEKPDVLEIILSKSDREDEDKYPGSDFHISRHGFSANPGLFKTEVVRSAFAEILSLKDSDGTEHLSFENFITGYANDRHLYTLKYFADGKATVSHAGELESTAREYHMVNSLTKEFKAGGDNYLSGFGVERKISKKNKLGMFFKLILASFSLCWRLWFSRESYDFAFRIYLAYLKKFKY